MSEPLYAFPRPRPAGEWHPDEVAEMIPRYSGLTLRDYFATAALAALVGEQTNMDSLMRVAERENMTIAHSAATWAYQYADAMLKAREQ